MTIFSLMTIFLAIGGFGFLFLLISFLVGDLFEMIGFDFGTDLDAGHDFGVFDSRVISMFLTAFGGFGVIGVSLGYGAVGSSLVRSARRICFRHDCLLLRQVSLQPAINEFGFDGRFDRTLGAGRRQYQTRSN